MTGSPLSESTIRTFWKAVACLAICLALNSFGCSKAPEGDVELPSWLTEDKPADASADAALASNPMADSQTGVGLSAEPAPLAAPAAAPASFGEFSATPQAAPIAPSAPAVQPFAAQQPAMTQPAPLTNPLQQAAIATAPPLEKAELRLKLQVGMRMPLIKVIDTELTQSSDNGLPEVHKSRLELGMIVSVEEQNAGQTRLAVRYNQIKLVRDAGGRRLEFDSSNPIVQTASTPELVAYRQMVGDGFSYWISAENQVVGVVGFQEFMNRCLGHMPDAAQRAAMLGIEGSSGEDGLADFVDNTIGLLPYNSAKAIGERWSREVAIARPVPLRRTETFTLKAIDPVTATVQIDADIEPSTSLGHQMDSEGGVRVVVNGGRLSGSCEIFRDTGLPKHSQTTESLDMVVQMAGGVEFGQTKKTTTTITAYPPQTF